MLKGFFLGSKAEPRGDKNIEDENPRKIAEILFLTIMCKEHFPKLGPSMSGRSIIFQREIPKSGLHLFVGLRSLSPLRSSRHKNPPLQANTC
jgi:hypothetical protein